MALVEVRVGNSRESPSGLSIYDEIVDAAAVGFHSGVEFDNPTRNSGASAMVYHKLAKDCTLPTHYHQLGSSNGAPSEVADIQQQDWLELEMYLLKCLA